MTCFDLSQLHNTTNSSQNNSIPHLLPTLNITGNGGSKRRAPGLKPAPDLRRFSKQSAPSKNSYSGISTAPTTISGRGHWQLFFSPHLLTFEPNMKTSSLKQRNGGSSSLAKIAQAANQSREPPKRNVTDVLMGTAPSPSAPTHRNPSGSPATKKTRGDVTPSPDTPSPMLTEPPAFPSSPPP